jgi:hypothetical protein
METVYDVALSEPDDEHVNTLVLSGIDIVVPLEMDADADPLHDEEVRLWAVDGSFDKLLHVAEPDVEPDIDSRLMLYRFRDVPPGVYRVSVKTSGHWSELYRSLVVAKDGAFVGGKKLGEDPREVTAAPYDAADPGAEEDLPDDDGLDPKEPKAEFLDQEMG